MQDDVRPHDLGACFLLTLTTQRELKKPLGDAPPPTVFTPCQTVVDHSAPAFAMWKIED